MSDDQPYQDLIRHTRSWIFDLPDSEILLPLLRLRLTAEEAGFLSRFPHRPSTLEQLSQQLNLAATELLKRMESLIREGFIYRVEGRSAVRYSFTDPIFFLYRMPGWKGEQDEWSRRYASMANRYYVDHMAADFMGHPTRGLRAIPLAHTIPDTRQVMPYEDVLRFVEQEDYHTVSTCPCRHRHKMDPNASPCSHETLNCLHFGNLGRYIVKHGMGKGIRKEETLDILARAAEAGLVHGISNTTEGMDTICNCCSCCCLFLEKVKMPSPVPRGHQPSNYVRQIRTETCIACGLCVKRCPMKALELRQKAPGSAPFPDERPPKGNKEVFFVADRCIGCGVCVHKCPTQSIWLLRRQAEQSYPKTLSETGARMLMERRRDISKAF